MVRIRHVASVAGLTLAVALALAACQSSPPSPPPPGGGTATTLTPADDLLAAVRAARAGAAFTLEDGTYTVTGTLPVGKDLTLTGGGPARVVIESAAGVPVIEVQGAALTLEGITLRRTDTSGGPVGTASGASLTLRDCAFTGGSAASGHGLELLGATTGTIERCAFFANGGSGLLAADTAAVAVTDSEAYDNGVDGVSFRGHSGGRLDRSSIHDNGSRGVRAGDDAHPTVANNQVSGNDGGIYYLGAAAGTLDGNTVSANTIGIWLAGQSQPTVVDNAALDNSDCGLRLSDQSMPAFVDNTLTGNGTNLCDWRTLNLPPLADNCGTASTTYNPDPANDLAVLVLDAAGDPAAGARVGMLELDPGGGSSFLETGYTGADGVIVLLDAGSAYPPARGQPFSAILEARQQTGAVSIITSCGNLTYPGTFVLRQTDPSLDPFTFDATLGGGTPSSVRTFVGTDWGGQSVLGLGNFIAVGEPARLRPGAHLVNLLAESATDGYDVYVPVTVAGGGSATIDVAAEPSGTFAFDARSASGSSGSRAANLLYRQDPALDQLNTGYLDARTVHATPGDYWGYSDLYLPDGSGNDWRYTFRFDALHVGLGTTRTVDVGGALTASLTSSRPSYAAGDTVYLTPGVVDAAGHPLSHVFTYLSSTTVTTMTLTPFRLPGTAGSSAGPATSPQALTDGHLVVRVRDPVGTVVANFATDLGYIPQRHAYTLPASPATGTYTAYLSLDLGPYQSAALTASTTFSVP